jgi:RimJ/RimL family protein N-acetyltransferase
MIALRRANLKDVDWIVDLLNGEETEPFLAGHAPRDREAVRMQVERSLDEPELAGTMIVELDGERAGTMKFELVSDAHRIARVGGLAVHPDFRGRGVAEEAARQFQRLLIFDLGFHRLELACYGFNDRAIRHSERVGFVREGVKRRAYLRHGEWQDAVQFSLLREDLEP